MRRNARLAVAGVTTAALVVPLGLALAAQSATAADTNLSAGKTATASSHTDVYPAPNVTDGNQATYWESANNAFPQWVQVDLGSAATVNQLTLKLPRGGWPTIRRRSPCWAARTGRASARSRTRPPTPSTPTATIGAVSATGTPRYVRLQITANSAWPAGQLSEFEV